jgi:(2Fe-2S) ferredoxin
MPKFECHVFVCENERPAGHPRGCCAGRGSEAVRLAMKDEISRRGLKGKVRANSAGCLDQCALGVTVVVYPQQVWYGNVKVEDVPEIFEKHLLGGQIVERLRIPDAVLNTKAATGVARD